MRTGTLGVGRYEKVFRYRLFAGIGLERCRLRGQRQVPGWQGKSTSASRRNQGLVWGERSRARLRSFIPNLYAIPERSFVKQVGALMRGPTLVLLMSNWRSGWRASYEV